MNQQSDLQSPQPIVSPSSSRSRTSTFREHVSRHRGLLCLLVGLAILLIAVGVFFMAHKYYQDFGGKGWLKVRDKSWEEDKQDVGNLFLPWRQVEIWEADSVHRRSPQDEVPFYACGDQQNSCEAFNQPNICCPSWATCYEASFTPSRIFCCNSSASEFDCQVSKSWPPKCLASLVECPAEAGGGCCPKDDVCAPNGCIHISTASILGASANSTTSVFNNVTQSPGTISPAPSGTNDVGSPITVTNTVTEVPAATVTVVKEGEVARIGADSRATIVETLLVPYSSGWLLIIVAALMGMR